ncbi:hypothetical protein ACVINZ_005107 [Mesorhizobium jarvisii]
MTNLVEVRNLRIEATTDARTHRRNHQGRQHRHRRRRDRRPDRGERLRQDNGGALPHGLCAARLPDHRRRDQCERQEHGGTVRKAARQIARHRHCLCSAKCRRLLQPLVDDHGASDRGHAHPRPYAARAGAKARGRTVPGFVAAGSGRDWRALPAPGFRRAIAAAVGGHGAYRRSQAGHLRRADHRRST